MATQQPIDRAKTQAFLEKLGANLSGTVLTALCALGDRLGLFRDLADNGPATSAELAARTGITERYAREWLGGLLSGGYLEYDPGTGRFTLPPEHAVALATEGGPLSMVGFIQMIPAWFGVLDRLTEAFRQGGGVHQAEYSPDLWDGLERHSSVIYENLLARRLLPALPEVTALLERGATLADVGCGRGRALIKLATLYPNSTFVGYDVFEPTIARATANATAAGVADRVRFEARDVSRGLPAEHDLITTFDVVHDAAHPGDLLRAIRQALRPGGRYLCLEVNCSEKLEENVGPIGTMYYGSSVMYCLTTSLANGGAGLGALGLPESRLRELCQAAGFGNFRRVPVENPYSTMYEAWG